MAKMSCANVTASDK